MDSEYKVGALCDLIASEKKKKKTNEISEKKNYNNQFQSGISINNLPTNGNLEKTKKRKSKKYSDELSIKKKKIERNVTNSLQDEVKPFTKDANQQTNNAESILPKKKKKTKKNVKNTISKVKKLPLVLEKSADSEPLLKVDNKQPNNTESILPKKKKNKTNSKVVNAPKTSEKNIKKIKDKKSNPKSNTIEKESVMSKLPDIKSSAEYIEKESRTVFVGNVPVNVKMTSIKNLFKKFGEIETTRLRSVAVKNLDVPKRVSIMKGDFHPQRDTANVYVRYKTIEEAQCALALNATQFEGHTLRVDLALNSGHKQNKKKGIFIGNLPYSIQEDEIWEFFKDCGTISAVRVVRDNMTGVSKGFGYVDFEDKESVELAIQLEGKRVQNRAIRIKRIDTKTKNNTNKVFDRKPLPFNKQKSFGNQNFQGELMKPKMHKKKQKLTKTDLMRKKIAKKLNA